MTEIPPESIGRRSRLGPGFLVAAAFIGPGTVVTASKAGAQFGCELLWTIVLACVGAIVLQSFAARLGITSGTGLGENLRQRLGASRWFRFVAILVILAIGLGNAAYQTGNLSGAATGLASIAGGGLSWWVLAMSAVSIAILSLGHGPSLQRILIGLVCLLSLAFLATAAIHLPAGPRWISGMFTPRILPGSLPLVLALIGTTIVPYNLFLHCSAAARNWADVPTETALRQSRWDTTLSIGLGGLVTAAIMMTASGAFFDRQITLGSIDDIARQLDPVLGPMAGALFGVGLFAAGLTSSITAPLAASFAIGGVLGWSRETHRWRSQSISIAVVLVGAGFAIASGTAPAETILLAQITNGLLLPIIAVLVLGAATTQTGPHAPRRGWLVVGWAVVAMVTVLAAWKIVDVV